MTDLELAYKRCAYCKGMMMNGHTLVRDGEDDMRFLALLFDEIMRLQTELRATASGEVKPLSAQKKTPGSRKWDFPVEHDAAHEVGEQEDGYPGGDIVTMECSNCGVRWKQELPQ